MADVSEATRRREIRRRKILDNSQDRLSRLLGHGGGGSNRDGLSSSQFSTTADSEDFKSTSENTLELTNRSDSFAGDSEKGLELRSHCNSGAPLHECHTPTSADNNDESIILPNLESSGMVFHTIRSTNLSGSGSRLPQNTETDKRDYTNSETGSVNECNPLPSQYVGRKNSPVKSDSTWSLDLVRRILYVVTAILWRLLLIGDFVPSNGKSIIYPFLPLELAIIACDALFVEQKRGTLTMLFNLFFSLLMTSVPTSMIDNIGKYFTVVSKVVEDLALYLFTFFICHCCVEQLILGQ